MAAETPTEDTQPVSTTQFDVAAWLEEVDDEARGTKRHDRLCYLLVANRGEWQLSRMSYLVAEYPGGHQLGLSTAEALELNHLDGFCRGLRACGIDVEKALEPYFGAYVRKHKLDQ